MNRAHCRVCAAVLFFLLMLAFSPGYALESILEPAPLPSSLKPHVERVLPSKPHDFFAVLKNGLTVLVRRQPQSDVTSSHVFVRAGSLYEDRFMTSGLSHYLEHVVSGGTTASFSEEEARNRLQRLGGATNAYTSFDRTVYYIDTSSQHWREALDLLLSYVSECSLDPKEVAREKSVIQQEFKLGENNVSRELWKLFTHTAYQVHPVRHPIIGYEGVFVQRNREDLKEYYSERYQPQNMTVSVVGDVDPVEVIEFVAEKTKSLSRRADEPIAWPEEPLQSSPRWAEQELPLARLTQALIGFPSVTLTHPDIYALDVLAILLGQGKTSRLYRSLKEEQNKVLSVSASNWTPDFVRGQFIVSVDLPPEQWPGIVKDIQEEIRAQEKSIPGEELEKAKKKVIARHVFHKESTSSMASSLASSYMDTGNPYFDEAYVKGVRAVTAEAVQRVAREYLDFDRMNVAAILPPSNEKEAKQVSPAQKPQAAKEDTAAAVSGVVPHKLDNGLKVLLKEEDSLPLVTIQLYGLGGLFLEKEKRPGISSFTASLLTAGTRKRTKQEIAEAIEGVGGSIGSGSGNNTYHVAIKVLKDDLDLALDILSDIVQNARFPEEEIEKERKETLLAIRRQDESWQHEVMRLFKKNFFDGNPYGHNRLGTEESVGSFRREEILDFYQKMVRPDRSVLAVYGDIDAPRVHDRIQELLAGWPAGSTPAPELGERDPLKSSREVEQKTDKTSAGLFIGTEGVAIQSQKRPVLDVLDALLSGINYPSGRLHKALRGGQRDLVYLVHAFPFYGIDTGYFGVITQTTLDNLPEVEQTIMDHLDRLRQEPVPEPELETAIDMAVTMHHLSLETLSSQAQSAVVNEILGLGWDYDARYPDLARDVSAEEINKLADKLFAHTLKVRTIPENPAQTLKEAPKMGDIHVDR